VADKLLVVALLGAADLGAYGVAWQLCLVLSLLTDSANRSYGPWLYAFLAAGKHQQAQPALRLVKLTYLALAGLLLASIVFGVALKALITAFANVDYVVARSCVLPISLGHAFTGAYYLVVNYVMFRQRFLILAAVSIGAGASNVALALLLIPGAGIEGAAWAFAASQALLFVGAWWLAARQVPMPWRLRWSRMP
jgi:O-antigen/teichoic acid export membrane protein